MNFIDNKREQAADLVLQIADAHRFDFVRKIAELVRVEPFDFTENYLADLLPMFLRQYMGSLDNAELIYFGEQKSMSLGEKLQSIDDDLERRMNSKLDEFRQQAIGITKYRWSTQGDDKVRGSHAARDGQIFSWDNPPAGGHPGSDFGCRCVAEPIIEEGFQIANSEEIVSDVGFDFVPVDPQKKYPKSGDKIEVTNPATGKVPDKVNIFVGGYGDGGEDGHGIVRKSGSLNKDIYGENYYFEWDEADKVDKLVQNLPERIEVNVIGHSWGGDTAARIALDNPNRINVLVTADPVTTVRLDPDFEEIQKSVGTWVDINATGRIGRESTGGDDAAAFLNGDWGDDPKDTADLYIEVPYAHEEFDAMLNTKPVYNNFEDILDDDKIKLSPGAIINDGL